MKDKGLRVKLALLDDNGQSAGLIRICLSSIL